MRAKRENNSYYYAVELSQYNQYTNKIKNRNIYI